MKRVLLDKINPTLKARQSKRTLWVIWLWIASAFLLQGCDPETDYEVYLDNRTTDTLWVQLLSDDSLTFGFRDTLVLPGELKLLNKWTMMGKNKDYECEAFRPGVIISTPDGRTSVKNGTEQSQWSSIYTREAFLWQCYLQIRNDDLQ